MAKSSHPKITIQPLRPAWPIQLLVAFFARLALFLFCLFNAPETTTGSRLHVNASAAIHHSGLGTGHWWPRGHSRRSTLRRQNWGTWPGSHWRSGHRGVRRQHGRSASARRGNDHVDVCVAFFTTGLFVHTTFGGVARNTSAAGVLHTVHLLTRKMQTLFYFMI